MASKHGDARSDRETNRSETPKVPADADVFAFEMITSSSARSTRWCRLGREKRFVACAIAAAILSLVAARASASGGSEACAPRVDLEHTSARANECLRDTLADPKGAPMAARRNTRSAIATAATNLLDFSINHATLLLATAGATIVALACRSLREKLSHAPKRAPVSTRRPLARREVELVAEPAHEEVRRASSPTLPSADCDPLTGLGGHAALHAALDHFDSRGTRYAIVLFDLDHLGRINDLFRRPTGDRCIELLAHVAREVSLDGDRAFRRDGAELAIVMPGVGIVAAATLARDVRARLANSSRSAGIELTASAGVAVFPDHGDAGTEVLRVAGLALRQAKLDGRDRVELARREGRESGTYATSIPPLFRSDVA